MTKQSERAKIEHAKFLRKMGCSPEQIAARKPKKPSKLVLGFEGTAANYFEQKPLSDVLQGDSDTATKRGILANISKENPHVQLQIREKSARMASLYNKGGLQYITPQSDPKTFGRK